MPPFPERTSALLSRLHGKHAGTSDKRTWIVGGKDANADSRETRLTQPTGLKRSFTPTASDVLANGTSNATTNDSDSPTTNGDTHGLGDLDMSSTASQPPPNLASAAHLSPGWEPGYRRLLFTAESILYEDTQFQLGLRSEYRGAMGCLILYFTNRSPSPIGSFTTTLDNPNSVDQLRIDTKSAPDSSIQPEGQAQQTVMFEAKGVFSLPPTIRISYLAGALQAITLQLPVVMHKFMDAADLSADDFFKRWRQIGGAPREAQRVFGLRDGGGRSKAMGDVEWTKRMAEAFGWGILKGVDPNERNVVGASVLHTGVGKLGCLLRLEPNWNTQVSETALQSKRLGVDDDSSIALRFERLMRASRLC